MNVIKNIHLLQGHLSPSQLEKLEAGASLHKGHSNIVFKIIDLNATSLDVRCEQGKTMAENYADTKVLITRTRELFSKFFPDKIIYTHPVPYSRPIVDVVDKEWIADKMLKKGIRIKDIQADTGIDKTNLSAWINGTRPMSQPVKAMFYFYLYRS